MPSQRATKVRERELEEQVKTLTEQVTYYEKILAKTDHKAILKKVPKPLTEYDTSLPDKVLALAYTGHQLQVIRAELGISEQQFSEWAESYIPFKLACARARDLAASHWLEMARKALEMKDWKVKQSDIQRMVSEINSFNALGDANGDASKLVRVSATGFEPSPADK